MIKLAHSIVGFSLYKILTQIEFSIIHRLRLYRIFKNQKGLDGKTFKLSHRPPDKFI